MNLKDVEEGVAALDFYNVSEPINIEFQNICYKSASRKGAIDRQYILKNISGTFYSGRLTAVVGPIGSGKTTLLHLLAGLKTNHAASNIKLNGRTLDTNSIRKKSSYITHDLPLLDHLTMFETLRFAADFKFSGNTSTITKLKLINNIIGELNLTECRNMRVSKLNESQRTRLTLAAGLITKSSVLYFDLRVRHFDDKELMLVLTYLKILVGHGRTIICALDQPTTKMLQHFDDVLLLNDGQRMYCGPYDRMDDLFANIGLVRPPYLGHVEFFLDIASQSETNEKYQQLSLNDDAIKSINITYGSDGPNHQNWNYQIGYWSQFTILLRRTILSMTRDFIFVQIRLFTNVIIAVFLGLVFFDIGNNAAKIYTNTTLLFFMAMFVFYVNSFPNIISIPADIAVFLQEYKYGLYSMEVFFIVKIITELIQHIIGSTVFLVISFFMTSQPAASFVHIWTILIMTAILSLGKSLWIATAVRNSTLQIYTLLFTSIPMIIFSGMFIKFNEVSPYFKPVLYISYFRYAFEGSMQSIYGFNRPNLICSDEFCYFKIPDRFLEAVFMGGDIYWYDVGGLAIWVMILFILFYAALKYRVVYRK